MKKPGFSYEQHEQMGKRIKAVLGEVDAMLVDFSAAYPHSDYEPRLRRAKSALLRLSLTMENRAFTEHPDKAKLGVY